MTVPYLCPNCKTNRTRFNIIEQVVKPVKLDASSGDVVEEMSDGNLDPFHIPYRGPSQKVQCGVCGLVGEESQFINTAKHNRRG